MLKKVAKVPGMRNTGSPVSEKNSSRQLGEEALALIRPGTAGPPGREGVREVLSVFSVHTQHI
jgi:hypothetical protein